MLQADWLASCLPLQGDWAWVEPATNGEFDVAVGAKVKNVEGDNYCVVDDEQKVRYSYTLRTYTAHRTVTPYEYTT